MAVVVMAACSVFRPSCCLVYVPAVDTIMDYLALGCGSIRSMLK